MSGLDAARRNRIRLWLRGERAFGVTSVRAVELVQDVEINEVISAAAQAAPPRRQAVLPVEAPMPKRAIVNVAPVKAPAAPPVGVPFEAPVLSGDEKIVRLKVMDEKEVSVCTK